MCRSVYLCSSRGGGNLGLSTQSFVTCQKYKTCYNGDKEHHYKDTQGFTLAEVLITIGIIGIVAALTIPALISNYRKSVVETRLKRSYSVLANAMLFAVKDNGESKNWASVNSKTFIDQYLVPYLPGSKTISEALLGGMYVYDSTGAKKALNGSYASGLKLKTGELIRVVNGFDPNKPYGYSQIGVIISQNKSGIYYFGKDYFTFYYDINKDTLLLYNGYSCKSDRGTLIQRCGMYGHDSACTALIACNSWKIPKDYPIRF